MNAADHDAEPASGLRAAPRPPPPWYETDDFQALTEVRRAFTKNGPPRSTAPTPEDGARQAVFWTLYELGHVIDELERRARDGGRGGCIVRTREIRPGHVMVELVVERPGPAGGAHG